MGTFMHTAAIVCYYWLLSSGIFSALYLAAFYVRPAYLGARRLWRRWRGRRSLFICAGRDYYSARRPKRFIG